MLSANDIRKQFIDFFVQKHAHTFVPSSPVVPVGDDTLLFANAGMNQFKDVFLGTGTRPYNKAVNTQKCIRAGGKHNDLDDVGKDTYHHTFFEMLGNWSFGDYFKKEAIQWAWQLLTEVWGLDKTRLHATVFEGNRDEGVPRDDEAFEFWRTMTDIDRAHIHLGNKKDNFWMMGDTGPCGPCTEIHFDRTPDKTGGKLVNAGDASVIEIWNLVFIQFNSVISEAGLALLQKWDSGEKAECEKLGFAERDAILAKHRTLDSLPAKHVDTGMGFERVTAVLQGKVSNYDTDVFSPIIEAISELTGRTYGGSLDDLVDIGFRVIADHLRMATFAITDGARPGPKKASAVLRSVIRRAVRFGYQYFNLREPFLFRLHPVIVEQMGDAFPELKKDPPNVAKIIRDEETDFFKNLQRGIVRFRKAADEINVANVKVFPGEVAADLQTTYGFPIDVTRQMVAELGMVVDEEEYKNAIERHQEISDAGKGSENFKVLKIELAETDDSPKFKGTTAKGKIIGWVKGDLVGNSGQFNAGDEPILLLDKTNFYSEQGGQIGDKGTIKTSTGTFDVTDTQRLAGHVLHVGKVVEGSIKVGQTATLEVSGEREHTMRNHTATHLLNWALRKVLGEHVEQKGSLVDATKTRFDFAHNEPLSADQIATVERLVNEQIYADLPVTAVTEPLENAKKIAGVRAVFGEKYPDPVRVLMIGAKKPEEATVEQSVEFCGGTHLEHTGQAGFFKIVGQELVSKGVRRVTAVTGKEAVATVQKLASVVDDLTGRFRCKPEDLAVRIEALQEEVKKLQQQIKKGTAIDLAGAADKLFAVGQKRGNALVIVGEMPAGPDEQMRTQADRLKQKAGSGVIVLGWAEDGKVGLMAAITDDLVAKGLHAGKLIGQIAPLVGGKGGGRPSMAQAGGKDSAKLGEALQLALTLVNQQLT